MKKPRFPMIGSAVFSFQCPLKPEFCRPLFVRNRQDGNFTLPKQVHQFVRKNADWQNANI